MGFGIYFIQLSIFKLFSNYFQNSKMSAQIVDMIKSYNLSTNDLIDVMREIIERETDVSTLNLITTGLAGIVDKYQQPEYQQPEYPTHPTAIMIKNEYDKLKSIATKLSGIFDGEHINEGETFDEEHINDGIENGFWKLTYNCDGELWSDYWGIDFDMRQNDWNKNLATCQLYGVLTEGEYEDLITDDDFERERFMQNHQLIQRLKLNNYHNNFIN